MPIYILPDAKVYLFKVHIVISLRFKVGKPYTKLSDSFRLRITSLQ